MNTSSFSFMQNKIKINKLVYCSTYLVSFVQIILRIYILFLFSYYFRIFLQIHCWMEVMPLVLKYVILEILRYYYFSLGLFSQFLVYYMCFSSFCGFLSLHFLFINIEMNCFCVNLKYAFLFLQSSILPSQPKSTVGTPAYIAPGILLRQEYDGKVCGSETNSFLSTRALMWRMRPSNL